MSKPIVNKFEAAIKDLQDQHGVRLEEISALELQEQTAVDAGDFQKVEGLRTLISAKIAMVERIELAIDKQKDAQSMHARMCAIDKIEDARESVDAELKRRFALVKERALQFVEIRNALLSVGGSFDYPCPVDSIDLISGASFLQMIKGKLIDPNESLIGTEAALDFSLEQALRKNADFYESRKRSI